MIIITDIIKVPSSNCCTRLFRDQPAEAKGRYVIFCQGFFYPVRAIFQDVTVSASIGAGCVVRPLSPMEHRGVNLVQLQCCKFEQIKLAGKGNLESR